MSSLMISGNLLFLFGYDAAVLLRSNANFDKGLVDVALGDKCLICLRRTDGCLV